jgi:mono/diheme cytochrome c family protein
MRAVPTLLVLSLLLVASCGGNGDAPPPPEGDAFTLTTAGTKRVSCASCHVMDGDLVAPGIAGPITAGRPGYWGDVLDGEGDTLVAAVAYCYQRFVQGAKPTRPTKMPKPGDFAEPAPADRARIAALVRQIEGAGTANAARKITFATDAQIAAVAAVEGDAERGKAVYAKSCAVCHGADGEGTSGPRLSGMGTEALRTVEHVRHGHEEMPPYSMEAMTDAQLADLARFVATW